MTTAPTPLPDAPRIAVIGTGVMGGTLITALRVAGWPQDRITAASRTEGSAKSVRDSHGVVVELDAAEAVKDADAVMLAVKPQDMAAALDQIAGSLKEGVLVITVAAALPTSFYEARLPAGTPVVRAMPNTPSVIARGATGIAAGANATPSHLQLAAGMLRATGLVVAVDEAQIDAVAAVSGSGPAYFYAFVEALTEAGVAQGLDRILATQLAAQTLVGAAHLLQTSGESPQHLRQSVSSKGGTTLAALAAMDHAGLQGVVAAGVNAAVTRAKELGQELAGEAPSSL
ncbi:MAG: pyrroline-5-carboxylate reductase [Demequina sp.]|jgi:pyrroline-5-carboxylate reductase|nr:pyrroline-5-carboxylate reductase [Demequina sp.]